MSNLFLNTVPLAVPEYSIRVGILPFETPDALRALRAEHVGTHVFKRGHLDDRPIIYAVATDGSFCQLSDERAELPSTRHLGIVRALIEEYFLREFRGKREIVGYGPLEVLTKGPVGDLIAEASGVETPPWLVVRRSHQIEIRIFSFERQEPFLGLVLNQRTYRRIGRSCAELMADGMDVSGLYVVDDVPKKDHRYSPYSRLLGRVAEVNGTKLTLADCREGFETVEATAVRPEADHAGLERCLRSAFGNEAGAIADRLFTLQAEGRSGPKFYEEMARVAERLGKRPMQLLPGFSLTALPMLGEGQAAFPATKHCPPALFVFDPTLAKPATSNKLQILSGGPYSQRGFSPSKPRICVICQRGRQGEVEQFLRKFFDGVNDPSRRCYFPNGFIKTYRLAGFEWRFFLAENTSASAYHKAALEALEAVQTEAQRWHLALVQVDESSHDFYGEENQYLVTKAAFLGQQVPVQEFETETMFQRGASLDFVLSNIALASYAKLGGTPWHLQVDQPMAHELVVGLGSAFVSESRLGARQRIVGITTLFTGEGRYMLGNLSKVVLFTEYRMAVTDMLQSAIARARQEMNWQPGEEVRLVFHSFKPMKDDEAEAVKAIVQSLTAEFHVDFAFLHVAQDQPLVLFDLNQRGMPAFGSRELKGAFAPKRGTYVPLSTFETLLVLTGPEEVKKPSDGMPSPLVLRLHRGSTFHDMRYLTKQVFDFSCHSWRSMNPAGMPVTILYSQLIARLLGRLGTLPHFSADSIVGRLNRLRWFL